MITGAAHVDILRRGDPVKQIKEDASNPACIYIGLTPNMDTPTSAGKWQIRRIENVGGVITTLFANDAKYNAVWDDRATYFPACVGDQPVPGDATNLFGSTVLYTGSTIAPVLVPAVADKTILSISIRNKVDQPAARRLEFSLDNVVYHVLRVGEAREETPLGGLKQVWLRSGTGAAVDYEVAINFGDV